MYTSPTRADTTLENEISKDTEHGRANALRCLVMLPEPKVGCFAVRSACRRTQCGANRMEAGFLSAGPHPPHPPTNKERCCTPCVGFPLDQSMRPSQTSLVTAVELGWACQAYPSSHRGTFPPLSCEGIRHSRTSYVLKKALCKTKQTPRHQKLIEANISHTRPHALTAPAR